MRTDLSPSFIAAKNSSSRKPRLLMVFQFPVAGNVYVSDQHIETGGVVYLPLVENWGTLSDTAAADNANSAEVRQMSVTLWNGGATPFSNKFLQEDPENVEVLLYQWFADLADSDKLLLDRFVVQDPIGFDESSRLLTLDLVSVNMRYTGRCGKTVTSEEWPHALPEHVGRDIPLIFGSAGECGSLCVKTSPMATIKGSIVSTSVTVECNEDLIAAGFPTSGILQIENEKISYSSRTTTTFYGVVRGYSSTKAESHPDNTKIHQFITDHTYLFGTLPIASITNVKVGGQEFDNSHYTVSLTAGYGKIICNKKPYYSQYAASAETREEWFDLVDEDSTAWQSYNAIDKEHTSTSAMINEAYRTLSLKNIYSMADQGMIVTAYLLVHHWETDVYTSDYCDVYVEGLGVIGKLSRPSGEDILRLEADVDIDHPHGYTDPGISTSDPTHPHYTDSTRGLAANGSPSDLHLYSHDPSGTASGWRYGYIYFYDLQPAALSSTITFNIGTELSGTAKVNEVKIETEWGGTVVLNNFDPDVGLNGTITIAGGGWPAVASNQNYWMKISIYVYTYYGSVDVYINAPIIAYNATVEEVDANKTDVSSYVSAGGSVQQLLTSNRDIEFISKKTPTRTLVDRFDLSDFITPSWDFFKNRKVQIRYVGSADDVNVFIPWITFEIEFRRRETIYSDDVTATVVGDTNNRPDNVLKRLLTVSGVPSSILKTGAFATAGAEFAALGYTIDGIIDGGMSVQDAVKKVCWQTRARLFWNAGGVKLAVRKAAKDLTIIKELGPDAYRLKSITAERQRVQDLVNSLELFYKPDRVAGEDTYLKSITRLDQASVDAHGLRDRRDDFRFDLVRSDAMAADLAEYFISTMANPSTFYEFSCYLQQLELEKEDCIALASSGFHKMRKMPLLLRQINHIFGSGKNKSINLLRIIAECLHYILIERSLNDTVQIMDDLVVVTGEWLGLSDSVHVTDGELYWEIGAAFTDTAIITDVLTLLWAIVEEYNEVMTMTDELRATVGVLFTDTVMISESLARWEEVGFGAGGFGQIGFGGLREIENGNPDEVLIVDELVMGSGVVNEDEFVMDDFLIASNGFGSAGPMRTEGFGKIPMGH